MAWNGRHWSVSGGATGRPFCSEEKRGPIKIGRVKKLLAAIGSKPTTLIAMVVLAGKPAVLVVTIGVTVATRTAAPLVTPTMGGVVKLITVNDVAVAAEQYRPRSR